MINNVLQRRVPRKSVDKSLMYLLEFIWENKLQIYIRKKSEYYVIFRFSFIANSNCTVCLFFLTKKIEPFFFCSLGI